MLVYTYDTSIYLSTRTTIRTKNLYVNWREAGTSALCCCLCLCYIVSVYMHNAKMHAVNCKHKHKDKKKKNKQKSCHVVSVHFSYKMAATGASTNFHGLHRESVRSYPILHDRASCHLKKNSKLKAGLLSRTTQAQGYQQKNNYNLLSG